MSDKEIALRLAEAWAKQRGLPVSIDEVINNYKYALEKINKESE